MVRTATYPVLTVTEVDENGDHSVSGGVSLSIADESALTDCTADMSSQPPNPLIDGTRGRSPESIGPARSSSTRKRSKSSLSPYSSPSDEGSYRSRFREPTLSERLDTVFLTEPEIRSDVIHRLQNGDSIKKTTEYLNSVLKPLRVGLSTWGKYVNEKKNSEFRSAQEEGMSKREKRTSSFAIGNAARLEAWESRNLELPTDDSDTTSRTAAEGFEHDEQWMESVGISSCLCDGAFICAGCEMEASMNPRT